MRLRVLTPQGPFLDEEVEVFVARSPEGEFAVLPGHTPLLALLLPGRARYRRGGGEVRLRLGPGLVEVLPQGVVVCAQEVERLEA